LVAAVDGAGGWQFNGMMAAMQQHHPQQQQEQNLPHQQNQQHFYLDISLHSAHVGEGSSAVAAAAMPLSSIGRASHVGGPASHVGGSAVHITNLSTMHTTMHNSTMHSTEQGVETNAAGHQSGIGDGMLQATTSNTIPGGAAVAATALGQAAQAARQPADDSVDATKAEARTRLRGKSSKGIPLQSDFSQPHSQHSGSRQKQSQVGYC
jgi:hypothetical protein